jgi:type IV secretion system protein VirB9
VTPVPEPEPVVAPVMSAAPTPSMQVELTLDAYEARDEPPAMTLKTITRANERAVIRPKSFNGAEVIFPYKPGAIYRIDTAVRYPVHLVFAPGEQVLMRGLGGDADKQKWTVEHADPAEVPVEQEQLLIQPNDPKAKPRRMTIVTDRGRYYLQLHAHLDAGLVAVSWKHPPKVPSSGGLFPPGRYYTGYAITPKGKSRPPWTPIRVIDTGAKGQTIIEFPPELGAMEAPMLYVMGPSGRQLVNRREYQHFYIVDRLFDEAELLLGVGKQQVVVKLARLPVAQRQVISCPTDPQCPKPITLTAVGVQ